MNSQSPIRHVLLAVDGSEHANAATRFIKELPLTEDCHINVIAVLIPRNAQYHVFLEEVLTQTRLRWVQLDEPQDWARNRALAVLADGGFGDR